MRTSFLSHILFLLVSFFFSYETIAQNNSTAKSKEELKKAMDDLKNVFKPKKKEPVVTNQPSDSKQTSTTVSISTAKSKNGLNPGDVLPDAKYVDADELVPFSGGAAVVKKGTATALIDAKGNFIVPYNTYKFLDDYYYQSNATTYGMVQKGLFHFYALDSRSGGVMNSKGKIVCQCFNAEYSDDKELVKAREGNNLYTYYDYNGNKFPLKKQLNKVSEKIGVYANDSYTKYGYMRITGEQLTDATFDETDAFSEGMAVAGKRNEFGEIKYGFINNQGKIVIPLNFSVRPGNFKYGFARVRPKDNSEFEYAYINKKGEVVWKQNTAELSKNSYFERFTSYGLSFNTYGLILDSTFKILSVKDFFARYGVKDVTGIASGDAFIENESNPKFWYWTGIDRSSISGKATFGFINLATKKTVPAVFEFINDNKFFFDPVSHLALVKIATGKASNGQLVYREGYINEDGYFVIVKGANSKW